MVAGYRYCGSTHFSGECFVAPEDLYAVVEGRRIVQLWAKIRDMQQACQRSGKRNLRSDVYTFPDKAEWIQVR
jgi:hypothetical protein